MVVLKVLLVVVSFLGLCEIVKSLRPVPDTMLPMLTVCATILLLMLAGYLGLLAFASTALFIVGILGFLWRTVIRRHILKIEVYGYILVCVLMAAFHYHGTYFTKNDSVSHWGLIVKYLLRYNALPNAGTQLIFFPSYPVGSGLFIYHICRMLGNTPGWMMAGQFVMNAAMILPLFEFIDRKRSECWIWALACALLMLWQVVWPFSLQVDMTLGYITFGGMALLRFYHRKHRRTTLALSVIAAAMMLIKSAGLFFALLLIATELIFRRDSGEAGIGKRKTDLLLPCAAVIVAFISWQIHVKLAYGNLNVGKHAVSLAHFSAELAQKTGPVIGKIVKAMIVNLFTIRRIVYAGLFWAACSALVSRSQGERKRYLRGYARTGLDCALIYSLWYFCLLIMYVVSMPVSEAVELAALSRYEQPVVIIAFGLCALNMMDYLAETGRMKSPKKKRRFCAGILSALVALTVLPIPGGSIGQTLFDRSLDGRSENEALLSLMERHAVPEGKSYIVISEKNSGFQQLYNAVKYELFSNDLAFILSDDKPDGNGFQTIQDVSLERRAGRREVVTDLASFIEKNGKRYDYILVLSKCESFERQLDALSFPDGLTVLYSYK